MITDSEYKKVRKLAIKEHRGKVLTKQEKGIIKMYERKIAKQNPEDDI